MLKVIALAIFFAAFGSAATAALYKWVDEKGVTHYGDTIPPQEKDRGNVELNKRGVVIRKTDPALTPEQRKMKEEELAREKAEQQKMVEQRRRDAALLATYTNEKEIDLKRNRDLQQVEVSIGNFQLTLKIAREKLAEERKQAEALLRAKKPVPEVVREDITQAEAEVQRLEGAIAAKRREMEETRLKYQEYKQRFVELRKAQGASPAAVRP